MCITHFKCLLDGWMLQLTVSPVYLVNSDLKAGNLLLKNVVFPQDYKIGNNDSQDRSANVDLEISDNINWTQDKMT